METQTAQAMPGCKHAGMIGQLVGVKHQCAKALFGLGQESFV